MWRVYLVVSILKEYSYLFNNFDDALFDQKSPAFLVPAADRGDNTPKITTDKICLRPIQGKMHKMNAVGSLYKTPYPWEKNVSYFSYSNFFYFKLKCIYLTLMALSF